MVDVNKLFKDVFNIQQGERVTILNDILEKPNKDYEFRKKLANEWSNELNAELVKYNATNAHNADLPEDVDFDFIFSKTDIVIALTEFSATAPLMKFNYRGASMPGFNKKMIPALELDYTEVAKRVKYYYDLLEKSDSCEIVFTVNGKDFNLFFDLSDSIPKKDDGICHEKGKIINLPSGEAFIVSNESKDSKTKGFLPIEYKGKLNIYEVKNNKIVGEDKHSELYTKIKNDPVVGNIAELAFGVLDEFGIKSCGKTLLDEKLGLHIALGRSDHLGGKTSPDNFVSLSNVWHQDFVYTKEMQPNIIVKQVKLGNKIIMKNSKFNSF